MKSKESKTEFALNVKKLSNPKDFEYNQNKLSDIKPHLQETFLVCLKLGGRIISSIKAVLFIENMSNKYQIEPIMFIELSTKFRGINALLDMKPDQELTIKETVN